jgi:dTDP-4-dehydrorhamnose 3,5-epimerase
MHFQYPPHCEWKLIACIKGKVHDVVVDLRCGSPTFLQKFAIELSGDNSLSLLVPPGCAHGFQTLEENCEMLYFHSHPFVSSAEGGIRTDDPLLSIMWPLSLTDRSVRDAKHPLLPANYTGVSL